MVEANRPDSNLGTEGVSDIKRLPSGELVARYNALMASLDLADVQLAELEADGISPSGPQDESFFAKVLTRTSWGDNAEALVRLRDKLENTPPEGLARVSALAVVMTELRRRRISPADYVGVKNPTTETPAVPERRRGEGEDDDSASETDLEGLLDPAQKIPQQNGRARHRRPESRSGGFRQFLRDVWSPNPELDHKPLDAFDDDDDRDDDENEATEEIRRPAAEKDPLTAEYDAALDRFAKITARRMSSPLLFDVYARRYRKGKARFGRAVQQQIARYEEQYQEDEGRPLPVPERRELVIQYFEDLQQAVAGDLASRKTAWLGRKLDSPKLWLRMVKRAGAGTLAGVAGKLSAGALGMMMSPEIGSIVGGVLLVAAARFSLARAVAQARGGYKPGKMTDVGSAMIAGSIRDEKPDHEVMSRAIDFGMDDDITLQRRRSRQAAYMGALAVLPFAGAVAAYGTPLASFLANHVPGMPASWRLSQAGGTLPEAPPPPSPEPRLPSQAPLPPGPPVNSTSDLLNFRGGGSLEAMGRVPDEIRVSQYRPVPGGLADGTMDGTLDGLLRRAGVSPTYGRIMELRDVLRSDNPSIADDLYLNEGQRLSLRATKDAIRAMAGRG